MPLNERLVTPRIGTSTLSSSLLSYSVLTSEIGSKRNWFSVGMAGLNSG